MSKRGLAVPVLLAAVVLGGAVGGGFLLRHEVRVHAEAATLAVGAGFEGVMPIPETELNDAMKVVDTTIASLIQAGNARLKNEYYFTWGAFGLTVLVSLISAVIGGTPASQAPAPPEGTGTPPPPPPKSPRRRSRSMLVIAVLAGLASACTVVASRFKDDGASYHANADELLKKSEAVRKDILSGGTDQATAQRLLRELDSMRQKLAR
ncbi:MAG: hypothetical protein U0414_31860 [Polyangiaceae bacterium]